MGVLGRPEAAHARDPGAQNTEWVSDPTGTGTPAFEASPRSLVLTPQHLNYLLIDDHRCGAPRAECLRLTPFGSSQGGSRTPPVSGSQQQGLGRGAHPMDRDDQHSTLVCSPRPPYNAGWTYVFDIAAGTCSVISYM